MVRWSRRWFPIRTLAAIAAAALAVACAQSPPKPAPPPAPAGPPKLGVVGLVTETKERGITQENWKGVVGSVFSNDTDSTVIGVIWEVTVFYDDGTTGVVKVDKDPSVRNGQRVRVTGNQIEPVRR